MAAAPYADKREAEFKCLSSRAPEIGNPPEAVARFGWGWEHKTKGHAPHGEN